ncbi:unnamed protein product [marine sediment metagenome]|uniref:Uncharacterized protein n=1 Tax=marine sediment metagenome TaxID=412755 RepID=X1EBL1_9ZZZZ
MDYFILGLIVSIIIQTIYLVVRMMKIEIHLNTLNELLNHIYTKIMIMEGRIK